MAGPEDDDTGDEAGGGIERAIAALRAVADDGVEFDGLAVDQDGDGLRLVVPGAAYEGLGTEEFGARAREHAASVHEWYVWHQEMPQDPAQWAFLRWVERADDHRPPERRDRLTGADGVTREWGQLAVTVRLPDPGQGRGQGPDGDWRRRRYTVRHTDDADRAADALERHTDPYAARRLRTEDDRGRYRPLSTAPTLQRGWALVDLGPTDLVRAVEGFYPATVSNWHREREGELDITHWTAATERQTGIYGVVQTWNRGEGHDHVDWVAEACCVDSQCLKRREWEYDDETPLSVDGGNGVFPCREPCSLVVAAARRWTRLEAEDSRTYEFELTPSEKEQVETIIDAVADGRTEAIREADTADDANRYRARFLRAKRFDEAGNLCGVPTDCEAGGEGDTGVGSDPDGTDDSGAEDGSEASNG